MEQLAIGEKERKQRQLVVSDKKGSCNLGRAIKCSAFFQVFCVLVCGRHLDLDVFKEASRFSV